MSRGVLPYYSGPSLGSLNPLSPRASKVLQSPRDLAVMPQSVFKNKRLLHAESSGTKYRLSVFKLRIKFDTSEDKSETLFESTF
jgi:hypothetical protein